VFDHGSTEHMVSDHCSIGVGKTKGRSGAQIRGERMTQRAMCPLDMCLIQSNTNQNVLICHNAGEVRESVTLHNHLYKNGQK
jgi:hypothetical protein